MRILLFIIPLLFIICFSPAYGALLSTQVYDVKYGDLILYSFDFSFDGTDAYFIYGPSSGSSGSTILVHYTLSQPYDIDNRVEQSRFNLFPNSPLGFLEYSYTAKISDDGKFFYVFGFNNSLPGQNIYKVKLDTPFVLGDSFPTVQIINYDNLNRDHILHADFGNNGNLLYTSHYFSKTISLWSLDNPYEISFDNLISTIQLDVYPGLLPIQISHDGNYLINGDHFRGIQIYPLSNPFDINSIQNGSGIRPEILINEFISDFEFINNGYSIFIKQNFDSMLYRYNLDMSYDLISIPQFQNTQPVSLPVPTNLFQADEIKIISIADETIIFNTSAGDITNLSIIPESELPTEGIPDGDFSEGLISWTVGNLQLGETITLTINLPFNVPINSPILKVNSTHWYDATSIVGSNDGDNVITLTITDGGFGDSDGMRDRQITDPIYIPGGNSGSIPSVIVSEPVSGGCSGDCTYPTIGLDKNQRRLVDNGFSYNGNKINAIPWHTPYPLITTETYKFNEMIIKAWDNTTIRLIQIGLGMPEIGLPTNDAEILIEVWFEPYTSNIEELKIIDPNNLIQYPLISAKSEMVDCRANNDEQCVSLTVNYAYDNIQKYNIVKVDVMDYARNIQSTTFNDGIDIFGTVVSDNPEKMMITSLPANHPSKYVAELSKVSNTNDLWIDEYGYHWIGDESKIILVENIPFTRHQDSTPNFGNYDRNHSNFEKMIQYEKQRAQKTLEELYGHQTAYN